MSELQTFKCPACGGRLEFDSKTQKLKCPFCDGEYEPETFDKGKDYTIKNSTFESNEGLNIYTCNTCGGQLITNKDTAATNCPYCGNPVVLKGNIEGDFKPSRIIPFKLDKNNAKDKYYEHLKGKLLLPKTFRNEAIIDEIKGVYIPFWLFDGTCHAQIWYDATKVRHWSDGDYDYTETSYYKLFRAGRLSFENVPVDASSYIDDDLTQSIEPFNNKELIDFSSNYLAGFLADKYDVSANECKKIADDRITNSTVDLFQATTAQYNTAFPTSKVLSIDEGKQEYVMLPAWILNIKYNNQDYKFIMNGQTGKFVGNLPVDKKKFWTFGISLFFVISIVAFLIQYFLI